MTKNPPITRYSFGHEDRIFYMGKECRWREETDHGHYIYEVGTTTVHHCIAHTALPSLIKDSRKFRFERGYYSLANVKLRAERKQTPLGDLTAEAAADVRFKHELVMAWRGQLVAIPLNEPDRKQRALDTVFQKVVTDAFHRDFTPKRAKSYKPVPLSTLLFWDRRLRAFNDDVRALTDGRKGSGNFTARFSSEEEGYIEAAIAEYLTPKQRSIRTVWRNLESTLYIENDRRRFAGLPELRVPHPKTLARRLAQIPEFVKIAMRKGLDQAETQFRAVYGGLPALRPGQRLEVDGWVCHLHTLLEASDLWADLPEDVKSRLRTVRITFIVVIDSATHVCLGIKFTWSESAKAVRDVLRMAMEDKTPIAKAYGCQSDWPQYGWGGWVHDNAAAYSEADVVEAVLKGLGTDQHSPAGIAWLRGRIEAFFRTIDADLLSHFTGRTGSNPADRTQFQQQRHASATNSQLVEKTIQWVVDEYHNTRHSDLGMSPKQAWFRLSQIAPPPPPLGPDKLIEIFGELDERSLDECGVVVANSQFQSPDLQAMRRKLGVRAKVTVKIDYQNLGQILVRIPDHLRDRNDPNADPWIIVPGPEDLSGISLRHLEFVDDDLAIRFGYDQATSDKHRHEARLAIDAYAREAAKARLTENTPDRAYIEKRQHKSFHPAIRFGDEKFLAQDLEALHAPVPLGSAKTPTSAQPAEPDIIDITFEDGK